MNNSITWKQLIILVIVLFVLWYIWVAIVPHHGKPAGTDTGATTPIEADHKWVNGVQIY